MQTNIILKKILSNMLKFKKNDVIINDFIIKNKKDLDLFLLILKNITDLKISLNQNKELKFNSFTKKKFKNSISIFSKANILKKEKEGKFDIIFNETNEKYLSSIQIFKNINTKNKRIDSEKIIKLKKRLDNYKLDWDLFINDNKVMFVFENNYLQLNEMELKPFIELIQNSSQVFIHKKNTNLKQDPNSIRICVII